MSARVGWRGAVASQLSRALPSLQRAADAVDDRFVSRSSVALTPGHPGVVPASYAVARISIATLVLPVLGAIVGTTAVRRTAAVKRLIERYPGLVDAVRRGDAVDYPADRIEHLPARGRYFISSDLHRCVRGTVDWPTHQNARELYDTALDFYAAGEWGLIENGDVEDFWLAGGSTYGVVYDLVRLAGHALRGRPGERLLRSLYRGHLERIVRNNEPTYARIREGFIEQGRYHRTVGNHDDVFLDPEMVDELGHHLPGVTVADFIVLDADGPGTGVAVITHGHHVDSWNAPWQSGLGKLGTWFGSILLDLPFASSPGVPSEAETAKLLGGGLAAVLTKVNPVLGANKDLYSVDETWLFEAFRRHEKVARGTDIDTGAWLLLGHTHLPLSKPLDPDSQATWSRYLNSGAGIFWECITGLEWDTTDPAEPVVRLVAWRFADTEEGVDDLLDDPRIVGWVDDRAVIREVLDRVPPADLLTVVDAGPGALMGARD